ncbi:MAG: creatininase [Burkholderiaceae bacterium]
MAETMDHLCWVASEQRIRGPNAIVLLPVGAMGKRSLHLPQATDALLTAAVAGTVARDVGGIVAPTITHGCPSPPKCDSGLRIQGLASLDASMLAALTCNIITGLDRRGVHNIGVVSGHYGNQSFLAEGIEMARRRSDATTLRIMRLEYWDFLADATIGHVLPVDFPSFALDYAAAIETSLMLHYFPNLVDMDRPTRNTAIDVPPYDMDPPRAGWVPASAQRGREIADAICTRIAAALRHEFVDG